MKQIPVGRGLFALVDDADYEGLARHKWYVDSRGYVARQLPGPSKHGGGRSWMHRELLPVPDDRMVDHRNRNKLDNQRHNLRPATHQQNSWNRKPRGGSSPYKGVTWNAASQKWQAAIKLAGHQIHLGLFVSEQDAARAFDAAALERHGEFAFLNFPPQPAESVAPTTTEAV